MQSSRVERAVRAADILAQRLPSVPDKPAAPAPMAGAAATSKAAAAGQGIKGAAKPVTAAESSANPKVVQHAAANPVASTTAAPNAVTIPKKSAPNTESDGAVADPISPAATGSETANSQTKPPAARPSPRLYSLLRRPCDGRRSPLACPSLTHRESRLRSTGSACR